MSPGQRPSSLVVLFWQYDWKTVTKDTLYFVLFFLWSYVVCDILAYVAVYPEFIMLQASVDGSCR